MALFGTRSRTTGEPRSANGASSFHLRWVLPASAPLTEAHAVLEVRRPPEVARLYFWALQADFAGGGGAHLGLQWNPRHPGHGAVNWGGYSAAGALLDGSPPSLPSRPGDPNTRDYPWSAGCPYRLSVAPTPGRSGWWRGTVTDLETGAATVVRDLAGGGDRLVGVVVWSEVFARCDHPSVAVRWSGLQAVAPDGATVLPGAVVVSYEARRAGGCDNTDVAVDGDGFLQVTNTERTTSHGAVVPLAT